MAKGIDVAAHAVPVWLENALLTECVNWTSKAIEALDPGKQAPRSEMVLQAALGLSLMWTEGMTNRSRDALQKSIELADQLKDREWQIRTQLGLIIFYHRRVDVKKALAATEAIEDLSSGDDNSGAMATVNSVKSAALFQHGEFAPALKLAHKAFEYFRTNEDFSQIGRRGINYSIYAQCVMTRIYWHQGLFDRTLPACDLVHSEAETSGNATSICQALTWCGCSLFTRLEGRSTNRVRQAGENSVTYEWQYQVRFDVGDPAMAESIRQKLRDPRLERLFDARR